MDAFDDCLAKGRLKQVDIDIERVATELTTAKEELIRARACYVGGNWGESATQAYFALYRTARAAINSQGYKDTNLYGLLAALKRLFVQTEKIPAKYVDYIRDGKDIKDVVYEGGRATRADAKMMLGWASYFCKSIFGLLALPGFEGDDIETGMPDAGPHPNDISDSQPAPPRMPGRNEAPPSHRHRFF